MISPLIFHLLNVNDKKKFLCECLNGQMNIVLLLFFNLAKPILKVFNQYFKYELCLHDDDDVDQMSMMMKLIR